MMLKPIPLETKFPYWCPHAQKVTARGLTEGSATPIVVFLEIWRGNFVCHNDEGVGVPPLTFSGRR